MLQDVGINVGDNHEEQRQEKYHFAMSGKSFAVITEHFQDLLQKVRSLTTQDVVMYMCSLGVNKKLNNTSMLV